MDLLFSMNYLKRIDADGKPIQNMDKLSLRNRWTRPAKLFRAGVCPLLQSGPAEAPAKFTGCGQACSEGNKMRGLWGPNVSRKRRRGRQRGGGRANRFFWAPGYVAASAGFRFVRSVSVQFCHTHLRDLPCCISLHDLRIWTTARNLDHGGQSTSPANGNARHASHDMASPSDAAPTRDGQSQPPRKRRVGSSCVWLLVAIAIALIAICWAWSRGTGESMGVAALETKFRELTASHEKLVHPQTPYPPPLPTPQPLRQTPQLPTLQPLRQTPHIRRPARPLVRSAHHQQQRGAHPHGQCRQRAQHGELGATRQVESLDKASKAAAAPRSKLDAGLTDFSKRVEALKLAVAKVPPAVPPGSSGVLVPPTPDLVKENLDL